MHHAERTSILYAEHRQGLFTLALSIVRDAAAAEDAVHDGVHRVLARAKAPEGDPVAFLYAAVRNAAIDATRRARVRQAAPADGSICDDRMPDPALRAADREAVLRVREAVDRLSQDQREVILLRSVARLGFEQVAEVIGAPVGTVAARYSRAVSALRQQMTEVTR
jgi:RNA polymerase sigma-70 factor (ECF subfamily)